MKHQVQRALHQVGLDLRRYTTLTSVSLRRQVLLERAGIDVAVDVGANVGQYARTLRRGGFTGRIISIEPQPLAFSQLARTASTDPLWDCRQVALAESDGEAVLRISRNSVSSSLLPMTDYMAAAFSEAALVAEEMVKRTTLASVVREAGVASDRLFLKVDAQGYEERVLEGASPVISRIRLIETELPLRPMYRGGSDFCRVMNYLADLNYWLVSLEPNTMDPETGHIVEVNALFARGN